MIPHPRRPRNEPNWRQQVEDHPAWCVLGKHDRATPHRSAPFTAGQQSPRNTVTAWLIQGADGGDVRVGLNVAHMAGLSIELPVAAGRALVEGLGGLLDVA